MKQVVHHYPPEVVELLAEVVPRLFKSKPAVIGFFIGAGVPRGLLRDLEQQLKQDPEAVKKAYITRRVLARINSKRDDPEYLTARREVLKRVVEFEDFSACWPKDRLPAEGLVSRLRHVVNVKDSFARMNEAREREQQARIRERERAVEQKALHERQLGNIRDDLYALFAYTDAAKRGIALEGVLNRLFQHERILVRDAFRRVSPTTTRVLEQIDGVVELDARIFITEMKWLRGPFDVDDASRHCVRVFARAEAHGLVLSYTQFTEAALEIACQALVQGRVFVLVTLEEVVRALDQRVSISDLLGKKVNAAIVDKKPFVSVC